jgi:Co/Zn/Cd efflux system component
MTACTRIRVCTLVAEAFHRGACSQARAQRMTKGRTLRIALTLNLAMFVIGTTAGLGAQSSGLLADALDMLADASAYAIGLLAVTRSPQRQQCKDHHGAADRLGTVERTSSNIEKDARAEQEQ